ncbi:MAG: ribosome maturation factor RimM [Christensenella sp.]
MTEYFELGRILKPQGIKGEIKFDAYTDDLSRFENLTFAYFKNADYERVEIESSRVDAHYAYLKLLGCDDRDAAEKLRGKALYIDRAHAAKLPQGAYYVADLIGCTIIDEQGVQIGVLQDILQNGAVDVYSVKTTTGICMFPALKQAVLTRDIEKRVITVDAQKLSEVAIYDI